MDSRLSTAAEFDPGAAVGAVRSLDRPPFSSGKRHPHADRATAAPARSSTRRPGGALVGETPQQNTVYVSRERRPAHDRAADTSLQSLSDPSLRWLQAVELNLLPGRVGEPAAHAGEEWIYVLAGAIEVDVNGSTMLLGAGRCRPLPRRRPPCAPQPARTKARPCSSSTRWKRRPCTSATDASTESGAR